jgi:BRCT domain type II-containing protein
MYVCAVYYRGDSTSDESNQTSSGIGASATAERGPIDPRERQRQTGPASAASATATSASSASSSNAAANNFASNGYGQSQY